MQYRICDGDHIFERKIMFGTWMDDFKEAIRPKNLILTEIRKIHDQIRDSKDIEHVQICKILSNTIEELKRIP